jgi:hypothetical protein
VSDVGFMLEGFWDDHPSESVMEIFIDVPGWLDGMHKGDSVVLEDADVVVDSMVHMGDEEAGEIIDCGHESSYRVMEELVVGEFFIRSVLIKIGVRDVFEWKVREAKTGMYHAEGCKDMVVTIFMEGLSREKLYEVGCDVEVDVGVLHVSSRGMNRVPYVWVVVRSIWEEIFLKPGVGVPGDWWCTGVVEPVVREGVCGEA